jgi:hypothetical protein
MLVHSSKHVIKSVGVAYSFFIFILVWFNISCQVSSDKKKIRAPNWGHHIWQNVPANQGIKVQGARCFEKLFEYSLIVCYSWTGKARTPWTFFNCIFSLGLDKFIDQEGIINIIKNAFSEKTEEMGDINIGSSIFCVGPHSTCRQPSQQPSEQLLQQVTQELWNNDLFSKNINE